MVWIDITDHQSLFSVWIYILSMPYLVSSDRYRFSSGHAVEFHVFADKFLNDGNCFSGQECTEDSAGAYSVKSMKDAERQKDSCCQAGEIKGGFDYFVFFS